LVDSEVALGITDIRYGIEVCGTALGMRALCPQSVMLTLISVINSRLDDLGKKLEISS
jgi:hypothetical protein